MPKVSAKAKLQVILYLTHSLVPIPTPTKCYCRLSRRKVIPGAEKTWFVVVEAGIETGGWKPEIRVSKASIDTSIDNLKRKLHFRHFWPGP
ncbi:MAG: hypothetical protein ABIL62_12845 [Planctomycetota bacterium]